MFNTPSEKVIEEEYETLSNFGNTFEHEDVITLKNRNVSQHRNDSGPKSINNTFGNSFTHFFTCRVFSFIHNYLHIVSNFSLTNIAFDRYLSLNKKDKLAAKMTRFSSLIVVVIWSFGAIVASPSIVVQKDMHSFNCEQASYESERDVNHSLSGSVSEDMDSFDEQPESTLGSGVYQLPYVVVLVVVGYWLPCGVVAWLHCSVAAVLEKSLRRDSANKKTKQVRFKLSAISFEVRRLQKSYNQNLKCFQDMF